MSFHSKKLLFIFGTRPEAIKMAPLVLESKRLGFKTRVCLSGQHKDMVKPFMKFFDLQSDYDLDVMKSNQTLSSLTGNTLIKIQNVIDIEKPDMIIVQGDTTTTFTGALAAFYNKIPVAHIEAGLRTFNNYSPFPEEVNRKMVTLFTALHFAPTETTKENLSKEGVLENVIVTGNTSIDALRIAKSIIKTDELEKRYNYIDFNKKIILVTTHRRENHGEPLREICKALAQLNKLFNVQIIIPVHLNPNVKSVIEEELGNLKGVYLMPPLDYPDFVFFMEKSYIILTDSGGVQEEGPYFGKPILVLRDNTERPEGIASGTSILVGTKFENILAETSSFFTDEKKYESFQKKVNPYGDGFSSLKILDRIVQYFNLPS